MTVEITDSEKAPTQKQLDALEKRLGIELPEAYRTFLKEHNAGQPEQPCYFEFDDPHRKGKQKGTVARFLGITDQERQSLEYRAEMYRDRVPDDILPIGYDPGGNLICLSVKGSHKGEVFFWDHEFEAEEDDEPTRENIYLISKNFIDFIKALKKDE